MKSRFAAKHLVSVLMTCVCALSSCGNPEEVSRTETQATPEASAVGIPAETETASQTVPPVPAESAPETAESSTPVEEEEHDYIVFSNHSPEENPDLPYTVDFESSGWTDYACRLLQHSFCEWYFEEIGEPTFDHVGNPVDEKTVVIKQKKLGDREPIPPGANSPSINFGNSELKDYSFSFDVLLNDSMLKFRVYDQSLFTDRESESEDPTRHTQPFWWCLSEEGLFVDGVFGKGSHFFETADGEVLLKGFDTGVWNNIELRPAGNSLHLLFNGEDLGEIYFFEGERVGAAGLSGARGGCMFKNIRLLPLSGNETRE